MKNKIKATYLFGTPKITFKGNYIDNLLLLGCLMDSMTKSVSMNEGCSYEQAKAFVQDLPNKLVYDDTKSNITFFKG